MNRRVLKEVLKEQGGRILLLVADGLGGVPHPEHDGKTALEAAHTPHLDELAGQSALGLTIPVARGITPGSGPAHLALFGYDPVEHEIGRGVLEAYGIGMELRPGDVAARGNFATLDAEGRVVDRRAGRISSEECKRLVDKLRAHIRRIEDVEILLEPGKEHRFVVVFRGEGLGANLPDTDPQKEGAFPLEPRGLDFKSRETARVVKAFLKKAREVLKDEPKANGILLRGFASLPKLESFEKRYRLRALALASYPMYRGVTRLLGMETPLSLKTFDDELAYLREHGAEYDFVYLHYKDPDKMGEDGNFPGKVQKIEELDARLPEILQLGFDVVAVTGDHPTPCLLKSHSWHLNPFLLYSRNGYAGMDGLPAFNERVCRQGSLGVFPSLEVMPLLLAAAGRLKKFGA